MAPGANNVNKDIAVGGYRPLRTDLAPFKARGAVVLAYFPVKPPNAQIWKSHVFLMFGKAA